MSITAIDAGTLATIASIIAAYGSSTLFFRVAREIEMHNQREINWIPCADRMMVGATILSLVLVILPLLLPPPNFWRFSSVPKAAYAAAVTLAAGYPFAILAHYRFLFSKKSAIECRVNPEPAERWLVLVTVLLAFATFICGLLP
jgi:hypothetical protein